MHKVKRNASAYYLTLFEESLTEIYVQQYLSKKICLFFHRRPSVPVSSIKNKTNKCYPEGLEGTRAAAKKVFKNATVSDLNDQDCIGRLISE